MTHVSRRSLISGMLTALILVSAISGASAQGKGGGNGKGGNGKGNGNGGSGNGSGRGRGPGSSSSTGGGKSRGPSKSSASSGIQGGDQPGALTSQGITSIGRTADLRFRHKNGFEEALARGRYTLKDNRGRTIVDRTAGPTDYARLRKMSGE
jgi:hypothetical protein